MHLCPDDVVPTLRHDLIFVDVPQEGLGAEFFRVRSFATGEETSLRGFEYSLARMLDGRRTAEDLVSAAQSVGLPISLEDLSAFVKKLVARGLVAATPAAPPSAGLEGRECWDDRTRQLFRTALRLGRRGQPELAVAALDLLLADAPNVVEAHSLRYGLQAELCSSESRLPFSAVFAQTGRNWRLEGTGEDEPSPPRASESRRRERLIAAGASLAIAVLALAVLALPAS